MKRYDCYMAIKDSVPADAAVVCSLQDATYEWNAVRPSNLNLLRVGMGLVTPCAIGLALVNPNQKIVAFDADGTLTLELGTVITLARYAPQNLTVVVFDNEAYNSGGMFPSPTAHGTDLARIASAAGVPNTSSTSDVEVFAEAFKQSTSGSELHFIVAKVQRIPENIARPRISGQENKFRFVREMEQIHSRRILPSDEGPSFFEGPVYADGLSGS